MTLYTAEYLSADTGEWTPLVLHDGTQEMANFAATSLAEAGVTCRVVKITTTISRDREIMDIILPNGVHYT